MGSCTPAAGLPRLGAVTCAAVAATGDGSNAAGSDTCCWSVAGWALAGPPAAAATMKDISSCVTASAAGGAGATAVGLTAPC